MISSAVSRSLLLCLVGFSLNAAAACTRSVTAQQGDTCASIASAAGITVTDFLRSNPGLTSCSALVAGASYCVEGTADSAAPTPSGTGAPPASSSPTGLKVSTDGTCGSGVTCAGSSYGQCCSAHGYCGNTDAYCGSGCQAGFGSCGSPPAGSSSSGPVATVTASVTVTVTSTVGVTRTSIATSTSVVVSTSVRTATTTRTVALTSYEVDTITTVVTSTSTRVVTSAGVCPVTTVFETEPCPITIIGTTPPSNTWTIGPPTTVIPGGVPSPTLPGTPRRCKQYDMILPGDTCRSIAERNALSLLDFYALNPSISCDALWQGYYVCVGR